MWSATYLSIVSNCIPIWFQLKLLKKNNKKKNTFSPRHALQPHSQSCLHTVHTRVFWEAWHNFYEHANANLDSNILL